MKRIVSFRTDDGLEFGLTSGSCGSCCFGPLGSDACNSAPEGCSDDDFLDAWREVKREPVHEHDCAVVVNARHGCSCGAEEEVRK